MKSHYVLFYKYSRIFIAISELFKRPIISYMTNIVASKLDITYKELLMKIVCNPKSRECIIHRCDNCPGTGPLYDYLYDFFDGFDDGTLIEYKQCN